MKHVLSSLASDQAWSNNAAIPYSTMAAEKKAKGVRLKGFDEIKLPNFFHSNWHTFEKCLSSVE